MEYTELRILGALAAGQNVGPESLCKTRGTELQQAVTELAMDIAGNYATPLDQSTAAGDFQLWDQIPLTAPLRSTLIPESKHLRGFQ